MRLDPEQIHDLLKNQYPRHLSDVQVCHITVSAMPAAKIVLIFKEHLWEGMHLDGDPIVGAHSMSLSMARELHTQLGEAIDQAGTL